MRLGRPPKLSSEQMALARRLVDEGRPVCAVAKILKVHRTTLYWALASAAEDGHKTVSPIPDGPW